MAEEAAKVAPMIIAEATPTPTPVSSVAPKVVQTVPASTSPTAPKFVLVVEDDVFLSSLLISRLQQAGINVQKAMTGEEALERLRGGTVPSLILLDVILPRKSGFEVLAEIQSDPNLQKAPVIITSNLGQGSDIERGKQLGAVHYFVKAQTPIEDLVNKVKEIIDGKS